MPKRRTFRSGGQVTARARAWIAESHRHEGNFVGIVEYGLVDPHPLAQAFATIIVPRHAARVDAAAWRLPDNQDTGTHAKLHNGPRPVLKRISTDSASGDFSLQRLEFVDQVRLASINARKLG